MTTKLCFPSKVLDQHLVVLGKTGAGKSSALRHVVEWLLHHRKRVCIIDPKGDWYGLKSSADGKGAGFPVILFGDFKDNIKSDVPLIPRSQLDDDEVDVTPAAKHVADLVVSGNRPCVLGMRGWTQGNMTRFWIDFGSSVFNGESGELFLVIDEVHNFAPKGKLQSVDAGKCLHWTNRIMNEGRGIGLINLIASQRPQKVHNDTLTACETLVAMRVIHKADRDAVEDWIKGCGDTKQGAEVLNTLAGMKRGEAFVWSPEIDFGPKRLAFPMFETFDSFAPARLQQKVREEGWASVDLTEVRNKLSAVIAKAKAEDPNELRKTLDAQAREIGQLRKQLEKAPAKAAGGKTDRQITALNAGAHRHMARLTDGLREALQLAEKFSTVTFDPLPDEAVEAAAKTIRQIVEAHVAGQNRKQVQNSRQAASVLSRLRGLANSSFEGEATASPPPSRGPAPPPAPRPPIDAGEGEWRLVRRQQQLLNAMAAMENLGIEEPTREAVALFVGRSTKPSRWGMDLKEMADLRLITYPSAGTLQLTEEGRRQAQPGASIQSLAELHAQWFQKLPKRQIDLLRVLIEEHPHSLTREELAQRVNRSTLPSRWGMDLREMLTLGLISYPRQSEVAASEMLFPPSLS